MIIDLNCDLGEGTPHDAELMRLISSANIACGAHAGDNDTMRRTLMLARQHGVAAGAHPGYADRSHFGRRELNLAPTEVYDLVSAQIRALQSVAAELSIAVTHVKPHGALYNQAARDPSLAEAVAATVRAVNPALTVFGLAGSELIRAAKAQGLSVAEEMFADRRYRSDGTLVSRSEPNALITDPAEACAQVRRVLEQGSIHTVCVHGDTPGAVRFVLQLRRALREAGIGIAARIHQPALAGDSSHRRRAED